MKIDYAAGDSNLSGYAVIIDSSAGSTLISGEKFFAVKGVSPYYIVLTGTETGSSRLSLLLEAAVYSGTGSIIYSLNMIKKIYLQY